MVIRAQLVSLVLICVSVTAAQAQPGVRDAFAPLGIRFERNVGQGPADAQFIAHGPGYVLMLTRSGAVVRSGNRRDVRVEFAGGTRTSVPIGDAAAAGVVNYIVGNDPSRWHTNITTFERVRYPDVYPGIDVVYHAAHGEMEYDILIDPGADPKQIRMRFDGADRMSLQDSGELVVHIDDRVLTVRKPVLYQEQRDVRRPVDGAFVRFANGDIGFDVGRYDTHAPLVIDPVLVYSSYLPMSVGSGSTQAHAPAAITVTADGAIYLMGSIGIPFAGSSQNDIFVAKINPSGSTLAFVTYVGGVANEAAKALALGPAGEIFLAGQTSSYDFPAVSAAQGVYGGQTDGFLVKLAPTGDAVEYATFAGGAQQDVAEAIAVDADGGAYLVGTTDSGNVNALTDGFVIKYDAVGAMSFSIVLGGFAQDEAHAAHIAPDGTLLIAGETGSQDFPTTAGAFQTTHTSREGFVTRLRTLDGLVLQSTFLGGSSLDEIRAIDTDAFGAVYVTGETFSSDFPTTAGVVQPAYPGTGFTNGFVTKLNPTLSGLLYSTFLGGSDTDSASRITVDALGRAVVTGPTSSLNYPQFSPLFPVSGSNRGPSFITKLSANASQFVYSTHWPATTTDLAIGPSGDAYVAGATSHSAYPTTADALVAPPSVDFSTRGVFARISDATPPCSFELRPSVVIVPSFASSSHAINVVAPSECFWTASSDDPTWLNPTTVNGAGTGAIMFSASSLTSGTRSATITVGNGTVQQSVTVYQRACSVSPTSPPVQPNSGGPVVIALKGSAGCPWAVITDAAWITASSAFDLLDGTGQGQLTLTLAPNTNIAARNGSVIVGDTTRGGAVLNIQQAGRCTTSLSSTSFSPHYTGATMSMTVTVAPADCQWTAKSDGPWLVPSVGHAVGTQTITLTAAPNTFGTRIGHLEIAGQSMTVLQLGPSFSSTPKVYPPSPPAGSGHSQAFTFTFFDSNGANKLDVVNVLINDFLDGGSACYLAYARSINVLYLVNDPGNALLPGLVLNGSAETVGNSQCQVDGIGSSAVITGNVLTLTLKMTFSEQFAGSKVVYQAARNVTGFNSGWVQQGVWTVPRQIPPPLEAVSMSPSRNSGSGNRFQFTFRALAGADHLVSTTVLVNGYLDGFRACYLGYHVPTNSILLLNDAGNGYIASVVLGTNTTVENSQCRIVALQSGAELNGTDLTLTLMIEFKPGFVGERVFYVSAQDDAGTSGWQAIGSWTVP